MLRIPVGNDYKKILGKLESKSVMNLKCGTGHGGSCGGTTKCKCISPTTLRRKQ